LFRLFFILVSIIYSNIGNATEGKELISAGNFLAMQSNYSEAEQYYKKAAKLNEPAAFYYLGMLELNGYGREKSLDNAVKLYTKAANLGDAQAQYELSVIYSVKEYGLIDNKKYLKWLQKAADNDHKLACHNLGNLAVRVGKTKTALVYFQKAAQQEHLPSIMSLGMIYYSGVGTSRDYTLAFKYLTLAAEKNDLKAMRLLATLHERGLGTPQDSDSAISLYKKAYKAGNLDAGYNLALLYLDKSLDAKNNKEAELLLKELAVKGVEKAKKYL